VVCPHHQLLRQARHDWRHDPSLRERYDQHRPQVERGIAHLATHRGRRIKLRYRGVTKNHSWLHDRFAGLNLRRLITLGLTRTEGAWAVA
jgi:hypothetical protein